MDRSSLLTMFSLGWRVVWVVLLVGRCRLRRIGFVSLWYTSCGCDSSGRQDSPMASYCLALSTREENKGGKHEDKDNHTDYWSNYYGSGIGSTRYSMLACSTTARQIKRSAVRIGRTEISFTEYMCGISEDLISILMREPNRTQSH